MPIDTRKLDSASSNVVRSRSQRKPVRSANDGQYKKASLNFDVELFARKTVTADERMFFTEQLALMLDTGNSLVESLKSIARYGESKALRDLVSDLASSVEQGQSFSQALQKHSSTFSTTYCNLVRASEQGGFMPEVLEELRNMDEKRLKLQAALKSALSYPVLLLSFSFAVVVFVLVVVFPKFSEMFASIGDDLPMTTQWLMALSNSIILHWPWYVAGLVVLIVGGVIASKIDRFVRSFDRLKLSIPGLKHVFVEMYLVQSMRVMALSLGRGVSVMDTLEACRDVVDNREYQELFRSLEADVQEGRGLAAGFRRSPFIPDLVRQMVTTGESAGNLPRVMERVSTYYERQLEKRLDMLSRAAEPVMLIIMGGVVGVIVSSLILPIFQMSNATG